MTEFGLIGVIAYGTYCAIFATLVYSNDWKTYNKTTKQTILTVFHLDLLSLFFAVLLSTGMEVQFVRAIAYIVLCTVPLYSIYKSVKLEYDNFYEKVSYPGDLLYYIAIIIPCQIIALLTFLILTGLIHLFLCFHNWIMG